MNEKAINYHSTKKILMNTCFIYDVQRINYGSTQLRGFSIANILGCDITPFNREIKNQKLIILKQRDYYKILDLTQNNEIIIDMVDFEFQQRKFDRSLFINFDYGLFSCKKQMELYREYFKYPEKCVVIYHHWDKKLENIKIKDIPYVRIGYFGLAQKCHLYSYFKDIDYHVMKLSTRRDFDLILNQYINYNVHYVIKPELLENQFGSLLKLSTASALGCLVISLRRGNEELLGEDYPFFCESFSEYDVLTAMERISSSYGSHNWVEALEIMKNVKDKTCLNNIVNEYLKL